MPKSKNIGLELTTDEKTTFRSWRQSINGQSDDSNADEKSNAEIIDEYIGNLQEAISALEPQKIIIEDDVIINS